MFNLFVSQESLILYLPEKGAGWSDGGTQKIVGLEQDCDKSKHILFFVYFYVSCQPLIQHKHLFLQADDRHS